MSGLHVGDDRAVVAARVTFPMLDDIAALLTPECLGVRLTGRIDGSLDDQKSAVAGLDLLKKSEKVSFFRIIAGRAVFRQRAEDRFGSHSGCLHEAPSTDNWFGELRLIR